MVQCIAHLTFKAKISTLVSYYWIDPRALRFLIFARRQPLQAVLFDDEE